MLKKNLSSGGIGIAKPQKINILCPMILEKFPEVQKLTASEKLLFVAELWNELESHPMDVPVAKEIIIELDRRMEHFQKHPNEFRTWDEVKLRVLGSRP